MFLKEFEEHTTITLSWIFYYKEISFHTFIELHTHVDALDDLIFLTHTDTSLLLSIFHFFQPWNRNLGTMTNWEPFEFLCWQWNGVSTVRLTNTSHSLAFRSQTFALNNRSLWSKSEAFSDFCPIASCALTFFYPLFIIRPSCSLFSLSATFFLLLQHGFWLIIHTKPKDTNSTKSTRLSFLVSSFTRCAKWHFRNLFTRPLPTEIKPRNTHKNSLNPTTLCPLQSISKPHDTLHHLNERLSRIFL